MASHKNWDRRTWMHPRVHDFTCGFGLGIDDGTKNSTTIPILFQDNALIDYETIKTNKENADWAVFPKPNCCAGSYVPKASFYWECWCPSVEIDVMRFQTQPINTSMLNRLEAFDKKTGNTVMDTLELQREVTDEQAGPLYNGTKLYEGHGVDDLSTDVPFLTTNGQLENIAYNPETVIDAIHYYSIRKMITTVSGRIRNHRIMGPLTRDVPVRELIKSGFSTSIPSICRFQNPYTYCGMIFHAPSVGNRLQYQLAGETSAIEHITFRCRVRFNEFNPDFNMSRA